YEYPSMPLCLIEIVTTPPPLAASFLPHHLAAHHRHHRPALEGPAVEGTVAGFGGELPHVHGPLPVEVDEGQVRGGAHGQGTAGHSQDTGRVEAHLGEKLGEAED